MTVYVDDMRAAFGRMIMCHMWADTLDELLAMADRIGVRRKWIQGHPELSFGKHRKASWVHFDISRGKRSLAVFSGAVETDRYGPVLHTTHLRLAWAIANHDDEARRKAEATIERITVLRKVARG